MRTLRDVKAVARGEAADEFCLLGLGLVELLALEGLLHLYR